MAWQLNQHESEQTPGHNEGPGSLVCCSAWVAKGWRRLSNWTAMSVQFSSVQSLSCVRLIATPRTAARQASLSITNSWSLLKLISDKTWSIGEEYGKPLQYSCLEKPMNSMKRKNEESMKKQTGKMVVWGGLTNSWEKKRHERQRRKDIPIWMQSSKEQPGETRKPSSVISAKK